MQYKVFQTAGSVFIWLHTSSRQLWATLHISMCYLQKCYYMFTHTTQWDANDKTNCSTRKKKKTLCPLFALLLQRQQHIVIQNVILARSVLSWTEASSLQLQFTFQDMFVPSSNCGSLWLHAQYRVALKLRDLYIMALCLAATKTRRLLKLMTMHSTDT